MNLLIMFVRPHTMRTGPLGFTTRRALSALNMGLDRILPPGDAVDVRVDTAYFLTISVVCLSRACVAGTLTPTTEIELAHPNYGDRFSAAYNGQHLIVKIRVSPS